MRSQRIGCIKTQWDESYGLEVRSEISVAPVRGSLAAIRFWKSPEIRPASRIAVVCQSDVRCDLSRLFSIELILGLLNLLISEDELGRMVVGLSC